MNSTTASPYSYKQDSNVPDFPDDRPVIVFDGYLALYSGWARFVLHQDRKTHLRLHAAQFAEPNSVLAVLP